jgi:hypothetical protein
MNYQTVVQEAMYRAGVREDVASVSVGDSGIAADFARWVADEYRALQTTSHGDRWFWRQELDQTISLVDGTNSYSLPAEIKDVNWNTARTWATQYEDENMCYFVDWYNFKMAYLTRTYQEQRPKYCTLDPAGTLYVSPTPDQAYTFGFDGVKDIDTVSIDADTFELPEEWEQSSDMLNITRTVQS